MLKKLIKLLVILSFIIESSGQSYALRPVVSRETAAAGLAHRLEQIKQPGRKRDIKNISRVEKTAAAGLRDGLSFFESDPRSPVYFKSLRSVGYLFDHDPE